MSSSISKLNDKGRLSFSVKNFNSLITSSLLDGSRSVVLRDFNRTRGLNELILHISLFLSMLEVLTSFLSIFLSIIHLFFLWSYRSLTNRFCKFFRKNHVCNHNITRFNVIAPEDLTDFILSSLSKFCTLSIEIKCFYRLSSITEMRANSRLQHLRDQICHRTQVGDHSRRLLHWNMEHHLNIHLSIESIRCTQSDCWEILVNRIFYFCILALVGYICPTKNNLCCWEDIPLAGLRIQSMFTWTERIFPNTFETVWNELSIDLTLRRRLKFLRIRIKVIIVTNIRGYNSTATNRHRSDRFLFHSSEPGIDSILTSTEYGDLKTFLTISLDKRPRILEVRVLLKRNFFSSDTIVICKRFTFKCCYDADFFVADFNPFDFWAYFKHLGVNTITTWHQAFDLLTTLTSILDKLLCLLKIAMSFDFLG